MIKISRKHFIDNGIILISIVALICVSVVISFYSEQQKTTEQSVSDLEPDGTSGLHALVISEVMSSNKGAYADATGEAYDWVELYNGTTHDINLTNFGLSDTRNETKWLFPSITIKAKSFLVVNLTNTQLPGLYANFGLKSEGGESVILRDTGGMIVDQIQLPALSANWVLARNNSGDWVILDQATPGFSNTSEGFDLYIASVTLTTSAIVISEVLPTNSGNFTSAMGTMPGYIEITNTGLSSVNLKNYALGDELKSPFQWRFPDKMLAAGASIVVYTSNLNRKEGELHADFSLSSKNGFIFLCDGSGHIIDRLDYESVPSGYSIQNNIGVIEISPALSPGYPNTIEGITAYQKSLATPNDLILNEVMTNNTKYLLHNGANAYSWIELKNNTSASIKLSDYTISKSNNVLNAVALPDVTLEAGALIVLMASGDANLSTSQHHHIDVKLSGDESVYLFKGNRLSDSLFVAGVKLNDSYGRSKDHGFIYMTSPSPNAENNSGVRAISLNAQNAIASGVFKAATLNVELRSSGKVYFTTNGATPTASSNLYTQAITLNQSSVLKTLTLEEGKMASDVLAYTYILNENFTLPVVSLTLDPDAFSNLQTHPSDTTLEYPGHIEYYDTEGGFSTNCGVQLFGGSVRWLPKKSFSITFETQYGSDKLNYPIFEKRDFSVFDTLILRSGSQDYETTFFRDMLGSSVMEDSETVEVQAYRSVILYINGKYWGLYNIREKVDDDFVATHYNVEETTTNVVRVDGNVSAGTKTSFVKLMNFVTTHNLSIDANYEVVKTFLNIDSYIDYWIAESFVSNNDMINTRFISSSQYDEGRMFMVFYDLDFAWYYPAREYYQFMTNPEGMSRLKVSTLLNRRLFENDTFRQRFLERLSLSLKTVWKEDIVLAKLDLIVKTLRPEIKRDFQRWGLDYAAWDERVEFVRGFIKARTPEFLKQTKAYFNLTQAEYNYYFGGL